jgi:hypothetical protein
VQRNGEAGVAGGKKGAGTGTTRTRAAAGEGGEPARHKSAGREDIARPGGMAMVDPWGALLAGLLEEGPAAEGRAADDAGEDGPRRELPGQVAPAKVRRGGGRARKGGRQPGPANGA